MADAKGYASRVLSGYSTALSQLYSRYNAVVSSIDYEHNMRRKQIDEERKEKRSQASAMNKVSLHNTKSTLLDRGLSKSGESVQANIDSNIALNTAFSDIEKSTQKEIAENESLRNKAKTSAVADYLDKYASIEMKKNEAYMAQLNADRAYEAERDDEKYRRFAETREYEAEREDEKYRRFADNRDYQAEREDEKYDRFADNRDYQAERDDEKYDRYADNRDYEAERNDEKYDRYADNRDYQAERDDEKFDRYANIRDYEMNYVKDILGVSKEEGEEGVNPRLGAKQLVDRIYNENMYNNKPDSRKVWTLINNIVNDTVLSYDYRYEVKLYAKARGLY